MHAKFLKYGVAPITAPRTSSGGEHPAWDDPMQSVPSPAWSDIEAAIRRLDARRFRHLQLWPSTDERTHDPNPGSHEFLTVIGGNGVYILSISFADGRQCFPHIAGWPGREVIVLPDEWGFVDGAWSEVAYRVCRDVELVVRAVRYYAEQGGLDPALNWETLA
jgi:hypothetical protein